MISYVRDKVVYCCWVSIYALINDVIYFFLFLHLAVPLGSVRGTAVGIHCFRGLILRHYQHEFRQGTDWGDAEREWMW
jgi:hypothetical protein